MPDKTTGQTLTEKMQAMFPDAVAIEFKINKKLRRPVFEFIKKIDEAHKKAAKSKLYFECSA